MQTSHTNPEQNSMDEEIQSDRFDAQKQELTKLHKQITALHEQQQLLKESLLLRESQLFNLYQHLHQRKKYLLRLMEEQINGGGSSTNESNSDNNIANGTNSRTNNGGSNNSNSNGATNNSQHVLELDIGLAEQFEEARACVEAQMREIERIRAEINMQGLSTSSQQFLQVKHRKQQTERQLPLGRKFSSTQYVRDFLQRPLAYKVAHEDVKYEFEMRSRVKEALEAEKRVWEQQKEEILRVMRKEKEREHTLEAERDRLRSILGLN